MKHSLKNGLLCPDTNKDPDSPLNNVQAVKKIREWALVLESRGIPFTFISTDDGLSLRIPADFFVQALDEIRKYQKENNAHVQSKASLHEPIRLRDHSITVWAIILLTAIFGLALRPSFHHVLLQIGCLSPDVMQKHEYWRLVTALTLHQDPSHLIGNMAIGGFIIVFLTDLMGAGASWFLTLLTGIMGNFLNLLFKDASFTSIGASTAVFGEIGLLAGHKLIQDHNFKGLIMPIGAALSLLAMLGTGDSHTDLGAHLFGLLSGIILGILWVKLHQPKKRSSGRGDHLMVALAIFIVVFAWAIALGKGLV